MEGLGFGVYKVRDWGLGCGGFRASGVEGLGRRVYRVWGFRF